MANAPIPVSYNAFVTQLANLAVENVTTVGSVVTPANAQFAALIPTALDYAELRIQRDCDLLALQTATVVGAVSGDNVLAIPASYFITVQTLSINGTPLTAVSKEWLQTVYGTNANSGQPAYFAPYGGGDFDAGGVTSLSFLLGPWPDSAYLVSVVGTTRMPSLYNYANATDAANKYTWISTYLPDLLLMAAMISVSGFQRNFSSSGSDPQMPVNYEQQYQALLRGAQGEEARRRFSASAWSSMAPASAATPSQ